jgi:hypothetical protein
MSSGVVMLPDAFKVAAAEWISGERLSVAKVR